MSYRKGYYKKNGTYVQGHFVDKRKKIITTKNKNSGCLGLIIFLFVVITSLACTNDGGCPTKKCADFSTQDEAQATFETDKDCYSNLDRDKDNIACEN